jgi:hypothetical protein
MVISMISTGVAATRFWRNISAVPSEHDAFLRDLLPRNLVQEGEKWCGRVTPARRCPPSL